MTTRFTTAPWTCRSCGFWWVKKRCCSYGIPLDVVQLLPCGISAAILIIRPLRSHQSVDKHAVSAPSQLACGRLKPERRGITC